MNIKINQTRDIKYERLINERDNRQNYGTIKQEASIQDQCKLCRRYEQFITHHKSNERTSRK